ncbi:MAG: hypothetical protein NVSMB39_6710 [Candidatus Saccharimonadales bacterium]
MNTLKKLLLIVSSLGMLLTPSASHAILNIDDNANLNNTTYYLEHEGIIPDCTAGGGGAGAALGGSDHVAAVYNFLTDKGLTPEQASGVIGNMIHESVGIEPERLQGHFTELIPADQVISMYAGLDTSQVGWGIVQWTPFTKFIDVAKQAGKDPSLMSVQLDFLWGQLSGTGFGSTLNETAALAALKTATTPEDAAAIFKATYERSGVDDSLIFRQTYAIAVFNYMKNGIPLPPEIATLISTSPIDGSATSGSGAAACPSTGSGSGGSGIAGYKNPFRDWPGIIPARIDSGVDYLGDAGPIYAIGNAKITHLNRSSYYGMNYLIYQFTDGAAAGLEVYLSEECNFPSSLHVGDTVTADTNICNYTPSPYGIEIGWSSMSSKGTYNVYWNNTVTGGGGTTDSNGGIDFNTFLVKLGAPSGVNLNTGPGNNPPPPADWPKW